ncbi:MAG: phytanoyl-CoA dioxygenase family protein [Chloroflexi bacterium]|nr:phytanoyl-CoA dioxygenase family protein [Chloroflexota bacterium]MCL5273801.1 phytanoyl-CoA dioxygenase family protein [Chloroflexota bacterium]
MGRLTQGQIDFFNTEGYLIHDDVFDPHDLAPLRREFEERIDRKIAALLAEGKLRNTYADQPFERRLTSIYRDSRENGEAVIAELEGPAGGGHHGIEMFRTITHPSLLAVVESLVGPEIIGSSVYRIRPKIPGIGRGIVPWHQDSGYFMQQCDNQTIITCWIPLVDATAENGCMQILPRAHRQGLVTHHTGGNAGFLVIEDGDLPPSPSKPVVAEAPLGGAVFMTNLTPHCSTPNRSDVIRWSVDLRYQGAEAPNNVGLWPNAEADEDELQEFQMACYPPEADFVVQSKLHPESVTDYAGFVRRREAFEQVKTIAYPKRGWTPVPLGAD